MQTVLARFGALAQRHALALWLVGVVAATVVTARTHYVADLSAFLPSAPTAEQAVLLDQLRSGIAARLVLVGIEGGGLPERTGASLKLATALRQSGAFESVHNGDNSQFEATGKFLFEHRYLLSPAVDAQRFTADGIRAAIDETTSLLGTPAGSRIKPLILRDPTGETVRMAETMLPSQSPRSEGGVWVSPDAERSVLLATTRADGADLDAQERTLQLVRTSFAPFEGQGLRLIVTGAGTFAVSSRTQIKSEVERLAIAGGVAIIGLLLLAFGGSLRNLLTAALPVASGVLAGIAAVSLTFGNVHGITLGFGTTLIGEAVDYAIYYLIQARPAAGFAAGSGSQRWLKDNWPTVRLGLLTSLCGFAALVFSGFPGLAQLGVFSIAGLTAAALTTRCVFPVLAPDGAPGMGVRRQLGLFTGACAAILPRLRWPLLAVALAAALALALMPSAWRGDLSSLNPVGAAAMQIEADLRADLGASDASTLVAISAGDEAGALVGAEAAAARLDQLVADGALRGYESPARLLPSPAMQAARRAALPEPKMLAERLSQATVGGPLSAPRLGAFLIDVETARGQPLLTRASLRNTPLASALDAMLVPGEAGRPWRALLSLQPGAEDIDVARLRAALADVPGARVVNIKGELNALYTRYLHEAIVQALLGALAVCALLALHQRSLKRLVRVALPVAAALVVVLAGLAFAGVALGILHLVGLLLMVAIGSNYALFFDQIRVDFEQTGRAADNDTLASLALANLTAVISFCLLALSNIPALRAIGQVVAPGILLSLVLAAAFIPTRERSAYGKISPPS